MAVALIEPPVFSESRVWELQAMGFPEHPCKLVSKSDWIAAMRHQPNSVNVISALASFVIPGLGQLIQACAPAVLIYFAIEVFIWCVIGSAALMFLGIRDGWGSPWCLLLLFISHVASEYDCASFKTC